MLHAINKIGQKISTFFGEPSSDVDGLNKYGFTGDPLANLLPWEAYDEKYGVFLSKNSIGFTIEAIPLVGSIDAVQKEMYSIFQEVMEEGDSIQFFLWADHRVQPFLKKWQQARHDSKDIYKQVSEKRIDYYLNTPNLSTRIFRFILSLSTQASPEPICLEKLKNKCEKILKLLRSFTYAYSWDASQFLDTTSALINYSSARKVQKRHWNHFQSLASQLPYGGLLKIEENGLYWETESRVHLKTFRVVDFPDAWSLPEMQALIGDVLREAFRIKEPFFFALWSSLSQAIQRGAQF